MIYSMYIYFLNNSVQHDLPGFPWPVTNPEWWNFNKRAYQRAKKVVSDSPGLVDFAIGLVNSVFNLPDGQVMCFEEF